MKARAIPKRLGKLFVRGVRRDVERTERSYRYHVRRVFGRPVRTLLTVLFMTLLVGVLYTFAYDGTTASVAVEAAGEDPLALAAALLPSLPIMLLIGLAMLVIVPISMVLGGVQREREYGFRR